ncbi:MAG: hypothetical protein ACLRLD_05950 [Lachnospira sp.]
METVLTNGFCEMSQDEIYETDGGVVICGVTIAGLTLLKIFGACAATGITAGITVGLNNKNRNSN